MIVSERELTTKLNDLVKQYVVLDQMVTAYKQQVESMAAIENPVKVSSLTEALQYANKVACRKERLDELKGLRDKAEFELGIVSRRLIELIPVSNCWIRAGDYAVGTYTDAWGGNHTELEVKPWRDGLEPLRDKMYYP